MEKASIYLNTKDLLIAIPIKGKKYTCKTDMGKNAVIQSGHPTRQKEHFSTQKEHLHP